MWDRQAAKEEKGRWDFPFFSKLGALGYQTPAQFEAKNYLNN